MEKTGQGTRTNGQEKGRPENTLTNINVLVLFYWKYWYKPTTKVGVYKMKSENPALKIF